MPVVVVEYRSAAGQTILKIRGDEQFRERVQKSLGKIGQTRAGQALLDGILANRMARKKYVTIHPPGPTGISQCGCANAESSVTRTLLAQAVFDDPAKFRNELRQCLIRAGHIDDGDWLAQAINDAPVYDIRGIPNPAASNLGVTAAQADAWLDGTAVFPAPFAGVQISMLQRALNSGN